ncbi:hypothetical protein PanWU01x14_110290 [Parasponia andersonii]|uniref:Uncharacterized protein n=1 Tax=Parasponia andersonii TaxID=3476 RepID=A0A2P5CZA0_PARAD|nr:hypothetical protein PanWU01x14_110290 [Parasponia andersonii]
MEYSLFIPLKNIPALLDIEIVTRTGNGKCLIHREDVGPDKVDNIDDLICQTRVVIPNDFLVDDDEFEDDTLEEYNDEEVELNDDSDTSSEEENEISDNRNRVREETRGCSVKKELRRLKTDRLKVEFCEKTGKPILDHGKISNFSNSSYPGYVVNGVKFLVDKCDGKHNTQNCGVHVPGSDGNYFYCAYWYKDDPFILASLAELIYYTNDDKNGPLWKLINKNGKCLIHREDVGPDKVDNIDDLICQTRVVIPNDFLVDDDEFEDDTLEEYNDEEVELNDDSDTSSEEENEISDNRNRVREETRGCSVKKELRRLKTDRLKVEFCEKTGKPILDHGKMFLNIFSKKVRDTIPASTLTWKDVKKEDIKLILNRIEVKFDYPCSDALFMDSIEQSMMANTRTFPSISGIYQWNILCNCFGSQEFEKLSTQKSENWSKQLYSPAQGSSTITSQMKAKAEMVTSRAEALTKTQSRAQSELGDGASSTESMVGPEQVDEFQIMSKDLWTRSR